MYGFKTCFHNSHGRQRSVARVVALVVSGIVIAVVFAFIVGLVVKALWNWLMPELFGLHEITYWQAFGLVILAKIFFGGFGSDHHEDRHPKVKHDSCDHKDFEEYWDHEGKAAFNGWLQDRKAKTVDECGKQSARPKRMKSDEK